MTSTTFSLRGIAVSAFGPSLLFGLGEGAILPVLPLTARAMGASVSMTALLIALIGIGSLVSNIPASLITMHRGERWTIVAGAIWCAIAMALCGWSGHVGMFAVGSFMVGMSQAIFTLARQSYLTEVVPIEFRARAMSTLGGTMRIGMFIGPFVAAAAIHQFGMAGAYGVGIGALLAAGAVAVRVPDLGAHGRQTKDDAGDAPRKAVTMWSTLRDHRHVFVTLGLGILLVSAVRTTRQTIIPLWADHLALEPSVTSIIYGLAGRCRHAAVLPSRQGDGPNGPTLGCRAFAGHHGAGTAGLALHDQRRNLADRGHGYWIWQRHWFGHDDDAGCRSRATRRACAFPGCLAPHRRHRGHVRTGPPVVARSHADLGRRHCRYWCGRISCGRPVGLLDTPGTHARRSKNHPLAMGTTAVRFWLVKALPRGLWRQPPHSFRLPLAGLPLRHSG